MKHTKMCKRCGFRFSVDVYGKRTDSKDGLDYYCKPCRKQINKINYEKRKEGLRPLEEPSTLVGRAVLADRRIPCVTGYSGGFSHVDLLAWGCVPIDAKLSFPIYGDARKYGWNIKKRQIEADSLFLCMAATPDKLRVFIVPKNMLLLPSRHRTDGEFPSAIRVTFGSTHSNAYIENMLLEYEDRYDLIEKARCEYVTETIDVSSALNDARSYYKEYGNRMGYASRPTTGLFGS